MITHHAMLYDDLADPVALLQGGGGKGRLAAYWPYATGAELNRESVTPYTSLMSQSQPMIANEVLAAYSFRAHRCLLDVGGGDGAFLSAVARKNPELRCLLFDLPAVAAHASDRFDREGLSARASAIGGSFLTDPLPAGADVISLVRIIHDHDDDHVNTLLRAVRAALPTGGTLLIAEPLAGIDGTEPIADAYFAFYLLAMGSGQPRTFAKLRSMLTEAGFADIVLKPAGMPMLTSVVTAKAA
jgi:demethylspheroidene O-methyltransferase